MTIKRTESNIDAIQGSTDGNKQSVFHFSFKSRSKDVLEFDLRVANHYTHHRDCQTYKMKFDWTRMHEASVDEQLVWLRAWEAQLQAHITRQRRMLDAESSVSGELLVMQRERLLKELQTVIIAAETRANDLECQLSSLRIAIGCQQLLS